MTELDVAKEIIVAFIEKDPSPRSVYEIFEIQSGNDKLLLEHINAIIRIFEKAKKQLEEEMKGDK